MCEGDCGSFLWCEVPCVSIDMTDCEKVLFIIRIA